MAKKEKKIDEHALFFVIKLIVPLVLILVVALGLDVYHAVNAIGNMYAG